MADHPGKERSCCWCGASLGFVENRYYDRNDICGGRECQRGMRDMWAQEREEAHEKLDRDMGW